jgi:hypothetical protein
MPGQRSAAAQSAASSGSNEVLKNTQVNNARGGDQCLVVASYVWLPCTVVTQMHLTVVHEFDLHCLQHRWESAKVPPTLLR